MSRYRLTRAAAADVDAILRDSARMFGPLQRERYAMLLHRAAEWVADEPTRAGSRHRPDIAEGVRSFPAGLVAERAGAASHVLYYRPDRDGVTILRVLHQAMDSLRHLD